MGAVFSSTRGEAVSVAPPSMDATALASLVARCKEDFFADDLDLPDSAHGRWTAQHVRAYYESGGLQVPEESSRLPAAGSRAEPAPAVWTDGPVSQPLAASGRAQAHTAHPVSCLRLWRNELRGLSCAGKILCVTGSWDTLVKVWSISDNDGRQSQPRLLTRLSADKVCAFLDFTVALLVPGVGKRPC